MAQFPGAGLGQAGIEGAGMPDSFRCRSAAARALRSVVVTVVMGMFLRFDAGGDAGLVPPMHPVR